MKLLLMDDNVKKRHHKMILLGEKPVKNLFTLMA